jgi:hypothetical protein
MNKILLLIVSFLIILSPLFGQKKTDEPNLKKGIKTETVLKYGYEDKFGKYEEVLEDKFIYQYDFNGNKVEYLRYDSTGSLSWRYIYKYELNENIFIESTHKTDAIDKLDKDEFNRCVATMAVMAFVVADLDKRLPR